MKKLTLTLIVLLIINIASAQNQFAHRKIIADHFISAVFKEKKDTRFIIQKYMSLLAEDTVLGIKKEVVVSNMFDSLRYKNGERLRSYDYKIYPYDKFGGVKKRFNTNDYKDIMVVSVKNKAIIYLLFIEDKINSFFTIEKGLLSFFVTI